MEVHLDHVSFLVELGDNGALHVNNTLGLLDVNKESDMTCASCAHAIFLLCCHFLTATR